MAKTWRSIALVASGAIVVAVGGWGGGFPLALIAAAAETMPANAPSTPSGAPQRRAGWWEFRTGRNTAGPSD